MYSTSVSLKSGVCVCACVSACILCVCVFEMSPIEIKFKSKWDIEINVQKKSQVIKSLCVNFYLNAIKATLSVFTCRFMMLSS